MSDSVSDVEIRRSLAELGFLLPAANRYLRDVQRGRLSVRDAVYFTLLDAAELERRRREEWRPVGVS